MSLPSRTDESTNPGSVAHRYDLIVSGGRVIDPSQGIDDVRDVALADGKVALVEADIPTHHASKVVDAAGMIVTPGLIDLHTHDFWGASRYGVDPDTVHIARGVTTVVDAGSSGASTFPAFRNYVIDRAKTRIFAFLNISAMGMVLGYAGLEDPRWANVQEAVRVGREHRDVVVGRQGQNTSPTRRQLPRNSRAGHRRGGRDGRHFHAPPGRYEHTRGPAPEHASTRRRPYAFISGTAQAATVSSIPKVDVLEEAWAAKEARGSLRRGARRAAASRLRRRNARWRKVSSPTPSAATSTSATWTGRSTTFSQHSRSSCTWE